LAQCVGRPIVDRHRNPDEPLAGAALPADAQAVGNVLLVSYFASAAADIFRAAVTDTVKHGGRPRLKGEITIDLNDVLDIGGELVERSGELFLANHREINLQNMQSIAKAFRDYFDYKRQPDEVINDIILSHACRHVIVHCGAVADRKMIGQIRSACPRTLKPSVVENQRIQFTEDEILIVTGRMESYLNDLSDAVGASR
jgi:hypothetical protein